MEVNGGPFFNDFKTEMSCLLFSEKIIKLNKNLTKLCYNHSTVKKTKQHIN